MTVFDLEKVGDDGVACVFIAESVMCYTGGMA